MSESVELQKEKRVPCWTQGLAWWWRVATSTHLRQAVFWLGASSMSVGRLRCYYWLNKLFKCLASFLPQLLLKIWILEKSMVIVCDVRVSTMRANSLSTSKITSDDRSCMDKVSMILEKTGLTTKYFQMNSSQIFKKRPVDYKLYFMKKSLWRLR